MILFLKEHRMLVGLQVVQFGFVFLILWLGGYRNISLLFYTIGLGFLFLGCYLAYHYVTRRAFYKRLEQPMASLDESLQKVGQVPIGEALNQLLRSQYRLYAHRIGETEAQKEEHMTFIDRWVHQMKTPLSVIDLTARELDEPASSSIRDETERIKTGLSTVLYMARLRTIEQDFQIKPAKLTNIVNDVIQDNKRYFIRHDVYPKLDSEHPEITVETDAKWLLFMVTQLVQNAVKYSAGKSKQIMMSLYERHGSAIVEVKDFGIGIPEEDRKRIYQAFYTGVNGRRYSESTGMGLFLVKEVADYLGHDLEMESVPGQGTSIRIVFSPEQNVTQM